MQNQFEATVGSVTADHNIQTINFTESYTNPVVFAFLSTTNGPDTAVARVRNVTSTSFQFNLEEADNMDGIHTTETINYIVMEAGKWQLPDGTLFEVGTFDTNQVTRDSGFETLSFNHDFSVAPVVLTNIQTDANNVGYFKTRQRDTTQDEVRFALEPDESAQNADVVNQETVGYIAIEETTGSWGSTLFEAGITSDSVRDSTFSVIYDQVYNGGSSVFIGTLASYDGPNAAALRGRGSSGTSQDIFVEEDTVNDAEVNHTTEEATYLVFDEDSTDLGIGVTAIPHSIQVSNGGGTLTNFGNVTLNNFSTSQVLELEDVIDTDSSGTLTLDDLKNLESSGELQVTDDGTDVVLDFSVGAQTGGVITLEGLSVSATQPIDTVDDLAAQIQVVITP